MDWLPLYLVIASSDLLDCDNFSDLSQFQWSENFENVVRYLIQYSSMGKGLVISDDAIGTVHFREKYHKGKAAHRV